MSTQTDNEKRIREIKRLNDLSAGNKLSGLPIQVEKMDVDLTALEGLPLAHPRLFMKAKEIPAFKEKIKQDVNYCSWQDFIKAQQKWIGVEPHEAPSVYPPETVKETRLWRPYWRRMYIACQESLNVVRNLSIIAKIEKNIDAFNTAKAWLLSLAEYDPQGATSRAYNDEAAFRVVAALAWGYDWLYEKLTDEERAKIKDRIIIRLEEVIDHLYNEIQLTENPLNSHGVRSISSVVVPCCIALYGEYDKAKEYLAYALKYYAGQYPPWGGRDGAWAEGADYWNTAMAVLTEAFDYVKGYIGIDLYQKEFYRNTGAFILNCMPVHSRRASFCDQSSIGDLPGLKLAYNLRVFSSLSNNPVYMWYFNQLKARDKDAESKFYNYGWWDFNYDTLRFGHLCEELKEEKPQADPYLKVFPEVGWAAFHKDMPNKEEHVHLIFKSSPFGSISHSHGDQNAFTLHAYGETLAAITGYYGGYGVDMHLKWRRQTCSKNLILIGGKGQYGENATSSKTHKDQNCLDAAGKITSYDENKNVPFLVGDATEAYRFHVPSIKSCKREIHSIEGDVFVIRDIVETTDEQTITWLMHTTFSADTKEKGFTIKGEKSKLDVSFLTEQENIESVEYVIGFGEVNPKEFEDLDVHSHVRTEFKAKKKHSIVTLLVPSKLNQDRAVTAKLAGEQLIVTREGKQYEVTFVEQS